VDENPYQSPKHADTSIEASLDEGEEILSHIVARSPSKRGWFFKLAELVIGKFIVTNRRVMFLSSGKTGTFGITESSMARRIAASVDFRAMSEESSWEFEFSNLRSAEASKYSVWLGCRLHFTGIDGCGLQVSHKVVPDGVTRKTWAELVTLIEQMKQSGGAQPPSKSL